MVTAGIKYGGITVRYGGTKVRTARKGPTLVLHKLTYGTICTSLGSRLAVKVAQRIRGAEIEVAGIGIQDSFLEAPGM